MIDWSRVDELRNDLGAEDFEEITALFLEEVEGRLDCLKSGKSEGPADDFHFVKGSAANLGFASLRQACETAEQSQDFNDVPALLDVYEKSKAAFLEKI